MSVQLRPKRSSVAGVAPTTSDLVDGEIAINTVDMIVYQRRGTSIVKIAGLGVRPGDPAEFSDAGFMLGDSQFRSNLYAAGLSITWQMTGAGGAVPVVDGGDVFRWGNLTAPKNLRIPAGYLGIGANEFGQALLLASGFTQDHIHTLPNKTGTYAMLDDIPSLGEDFISGFEIRTTATQIIVGPGRAVIQSTGQVASSGGTTITSSRSSNTWYHLYLSSSGVITRQSSAPNPVPYSGKARSDSFSPGRRYLGSVRTSGTNYIIQHCPPTFGSGPTKVTFLHNTSVNSRIIGNGSSTTPTDVSLTSFAPENTTYTATFRIQNVHTSSIVRYYIWTGSEFTIYSNVGGLSSIVTDVNTDGTPKIQYDVPAGGTAAFIDVLGYSFYR